MRNDVLLNGLLDMINYPVFAKDENFVFSFCNQAFADYLGTEIKDVVGKTISQLFDSESANISHQTDLELFQSGTAQKYEATFSTPEGSPRYCIVQKQILIGSNGAKIGIIGYMEDIAAHKTRQREITVAENKYKKIFDNAQDVYYHTDENGIIKEISPSVKKYLKLIDDEIVGKPIEKFYYHPEDRKVTLKKIEKEGEVFDYEVLLKGKDNQKLWTSVNAHFLYDKSGKFSGVEGSIRDISERKRNEERIKQSLSLLQATTNSTADGILVVDRKGRIISFNDTFKNIFGLSDSVLELGKDNDALAEALKMVKDPDLFLARVRHLYNNPEQESYDTIDFKDGRIIERYSRPQWIDGQPVGRVWRFRDDTERRKTEQQLNLMAHALKSIKECISITDINNQILFINDAFAKTYGYSNEELIDKSISIVRPPDNDQAITKEILDLTNDSGWKGELLNQRKDGAVFPISLSTTIVKNDKGETLGLVGVASDITERKREEQNLKENEERYRSLFEGSPDAIFLADTETGMIIGANTASSSLLKKPLDQIIGMKQWELHPTDNAEDSKRIFREHLSVLNRGETFKNFESSVLCSDGSVIPIEIRANLIHIKGKSTIQGVFRDVSDRKAAEKAILESEKRYRMLIENQGEGVTIVDANENFTFVNPATERIFEAVPGTLNGRNMKEFVSPEQYEHIKKETKKRSENEKSTYELEIKTDKGNIRTILITGTPQTDESGRFTGTFGVLRDITEWKKAETEIQAKEALLNTLVQTSPDLIWIKDVNGIYLTCNKIFERYFGASIDQIIGKNDYNFLGRELADFFRENDRKAIENGKPTINEEWINSADDGRKVLLETIKTPMYDLNGELIGVLGVSRDISDRKQAEEQLRQSEEKYRNLIKSMPDGVYRSTHKGKFVEVNPAMVRLLGYDSANELLNIDIKKQLYFDLEDRESLALKLNDKELDIYPLKKKDGSAVYVEDHGWYVKDDKGKIVFHEGILRDVTGRKMAELQLQKYSQKLQELNATKDKFFSIIAHDLKSPFSSITGLSEILKNEARHLDIQTIEQYAQIINYTANHTYQLLENLLNWSLVQQSHIDFQPGPIVVNQVVSDILALMTEKVDSKKITVENLISENLIVRADENMVKTIFRNLISNALKFTAKNGTIQISARPGEEEIEFTVKDSGTGISKENIAKIFNAGSTFSQRGTENERGTGLGLALCKEFVEKHKGRIWVESELGIGSEFKFTLSAKP